jgi:hypothetical protein
MKTTTVASLFAFFWMSSMFSFSTGDAMITGVMTSENESYSTVLEVRVILEELEMTVNTIGGSKSLSLSSRPTAGIEIESGNIVPLIDGANVNIDDLEDLLISGDITLLADGDIIVEDDFSPQLTSIRTLTFKSGRDLVFQNDADINSSGSSLNVLLWADSDGDEAGGVLLDSNSSISTSNGHLWIGGGSGEATWNGLDVGDSYAVGLTTLASGSFQPYSGIHLLGEILNLGTGDVYLNGKSTETDNANGIGIRLNGMDIIAHQIYMVGVGSENENTSGNTSRGNWGVGLENTSITANGDLIVEGVAGGQKAGENGGYNYGVFMDNNSSLRGLDQASITLKGTGGGNPGIPNNIDNDGLRINGGLIRVDEGNITFQGTSGVNVASADFDQNGGVVVSRDSSNNLSTGKITAIANQFDISSTVRYASLGTLEIRPREASTTIGIGGAPGQLQLPSVYFTSNFEDGFSEILLGCEDQTGDIRVRESLFTDHATLKSSGKLLFEGNITTTDNSKLTVINDDLSFTSPTNFAVAGEFEYIPFTENLENPITFPMPNLSIQSSGLLIGKKGSQRDIHIVQSVESSKTIELYGGDIFIDGSLKTTGSASLIIEGNTIVSPGNYLASESNLTHTGNIIFKSDATGEAYLGEVKGTYTANEGKAIVEKYYAARRAFRFVTSPVESSQTIFESYQNAGVNEAGVGTHITGSSVGADGFDPTTTGNPSMFSFNSSTAWMPIPNTDTKKLSAGIPYRLMIRGDRGTDLANNEAAPSETRLNVEGDLKTGSFSLSPETLFSDPKYLSLVGNPYQATIDIRDLLAASTEVNTSHYYVWDPMINTRGGFVTVDLTDGSNTQGSTTASELIGPSQAFFIESKTASPNLNFSEDLKATQPKNKTAGPNHKTIQSQLKLELLDDSATLIDGFKIKFDDNGNNSIDLADAEKLLNLDENLAIHNNEVLLSIESRAFPIDEERMGLFIDNWRAMEYSLRLTSQNLEQVDIVIIDSYLDTETLLSDGDVYSFTIDPTIEESINAYRFEIAFSMESLSASEFDTAQLQLYPNPVQNEFRINTPWTGEELRVEIYNLLGQKIAHQSFTSETIQMDASTWSEGVYVVKVKKGKEVFTTKMIKQ